jgi:hypothetical protein
MYVCMYVVIYIVCVCIIGAEYCTNFRWIRGRILHKSCMPILKFVYIRWVLTDCMYVCMHINLGDGLGSISLRQSYEAASLCHKLVHIVIHTTLSYTHTYINTHEQNNILN